SLTSHIRAALEAGREDVAENYAIRLEQQPGATPMKNPTRTRRHWGRCPDGAGKRRGAVLVLTALLLVLLAGMLAFSIDLGYMYTVQGQLDRAVDSAALAGAGKLFEGDQAAYEEVVEYLVRNPVGSGNTVTDESQIELLKTEWLRQHQNDLQVSTGNWDPVTRQLQPATLSNPASALEVSMDYSGMPTFFGRILGKETFSVHSKAIATYQPRDIVVVIDLSASMNDDSELKSLSRLGRRTVEANLYQIWKDLGSPKYGKMRFTPRYISTNNTRKIKRALGLNRVPYPYPSGSWNDYISYVKYDYYVRRAGYRKRYGMLTLINYWLYRKPLHSQTPDLWKASCQPIQSVKDAVDVFIDYMEQNTTQDRVGLAVYNSSRGVGSLEVRLTKNFSATRSSTRAKQAGHYHGWTNIGGGLQTARQHLQNEGRPASFKMIVLLTDGVTNWTARGYNPSAARAQVISEANLCKDLGYPVFTISLGAGADKNMMDQVADLTGGTHFNIPGGRSVAQYRLQLMEAFRQIAAHRPLKLVANNYRE
ncbi:MAG: VWA domain-containing protein, partial [Candidatus Zixiibacteriota bacterium]